MKTSLLALAIFSAWFTLGCSQRSGDASSPKVTTTAPEKSGYFKEGDPAPDFEALAHNGEKVHLAELRGKSVILYFYPKDGTPGCSVEADAFKSESPELSKASAVVLGVSSDDAESHRAFATEHGLPFLLLPDTEHVIAKIYGVGSTLGMMSRVTYLIGPDGKIAKVYPNVTPSTHAAEVLRDVQKLRAAP
jgi:peroxiredoxin Q/BCP